MQVRGNMDMEIKCDCGRLIWAKETTTVSELEEQGWEVGFDWAQCPECSSKKQLLERIICKKCEQEAQVPPHRVEEGVCAKCWAEQNPLSDELKEFCKLLEGDSHGL